MNTLNCKGRLLDLSDPIVMGILNLTPDSFYDGGVNNSMDIALQQVENMLEEGASIIDVGGMSSRPGAEIIDEEEEQKRVLPVIQKIASKWPKAIISIDTVHSSVAEAAIQAGASIVNDISAGEIDEKIWDVCIRHSTPYIMMHMQGNPENMQDNPLYSDVVLDILTYLRDKVWHLRNRGMKDIIVDPGFGFGKTIEQNYKLLKHLSSFEIIGNPILVGMSRKSMIYKLLENTPNEALNGTTACHMIALQNGAKILRVHDVKAASDCIKIHLALEK